MLQSKVRLGYKKIPKRELLLPQREDLQTTRNQWFMKIGYQIYFSCTNYITAKKRRNFKINDDFLKKFEENFGRNVKVANFELLNNEAA